MSECDYFSLLPVDATELILSRLDFDSLKKCSLVSLSWKNIICSGDVSEIVWKKMGYYLGLDTKKIVGLTNRQAVLKRHNKLLTILFDALAKKDDLISLLYRICMPVSFGERRERECIATIEKILLSERSECQSYYELAREIYPFNDEWFSHFEESDWEDVTLWIKAFSKVLEYTSYRPSSVFITKRHISKKYGDGCFIYETKLDIELKAFIAVDLTAYLKDKYGIVISHHNSYWKTHKHFTFSEKAPPYKKRIRERVIEKVKENQSKRKKTEEEEKEKEKKENSIPNNGPPYIKIYNMILNGYTGHNIDFIKLLRNTQYEYLPPEFQQMNSVVLETKHYGRWLIFHNGTFVVTGVTDPSKEKEIFKAVVDEVERCECFI